jgi:hypothetical protein
MHVDIFEDMNLAEINPDLALVPDGPYKFRVIEAGKKPFVYKDDLPEKGIVKGDASTYVKFGFSIFDDPDQAGRRVYQTVFQDNQSVRGLRVLMDATGVPQTGSLDNWLTELVTQRAEFQGILSSREDKRGQMRSEVRLTAVKPI